METNSTSIHLKFFQRKYNFKSKLTNNLNAILFYLLNVFYVRDRSPTLFSFSGAPCNPTLYWTGRDSSGGIPVACGGGGFRLIKNRIPLKWRFIIRNYFFLSKTPINLIQLFSIKRLKENCYLLLTFLTRWLTPSWIRCSGTCICCWYMLRLRAIVYL